MRQNVTAAEFLTTILMPCIHVANLSSSAAGIGYFISVNVTCARLLKLATFWMSVEVFRLPSSILQGVTTVREHSKQHDKLLIVCYLAFRWF